MLHLTLSFLFKEKIFKLKNFLATFNFLHFRSSSWALLASQSRLVTTDYFFAFQIPPKPLKIYKPTKHIKMQVVDLDTVPLFEERDDSANTFDIGEVSSPLQRKQKYFNIHDAMTIGEFQD